MMNNKDEKAYAVLMCDELLDYALEKDVDISGVTLENFNCYLDDQFEDGGEARCEHFADLGLEYSLQFGELDSPKQMSAQWRVVKHAVKLLEKYFGNSAK